MPTWDKINRYWIGRVKLSGFPTRIKRGFETKSAAKEWERVEKDALKTQSNALAFSAACGQYLEYCERRFQKNTYRQKAFILRQLITSFGFDPEITSIKPLMISRYLDQRFDADGGKAANRDLREINSLFNWLNRSGVFDGNPAKTIERFAETEWSKYVPPIEDIKRVIMVAAPKERIFIQTILHTGARLSEMLRLTWEDINFEKATIRFTTRKRKGGGLESDHVDLNNTAGDILSGIFVTRNKETPFVFPARDGGQGSKYSWDNVMPRLCKKAGVKPFGFHALRHYVAATLADSGKLSLSEIRDQLRHKRSTTTDVYLKSLVREKSRAADILDKAFGDEKKENVTKLVTIK